MTKRRGPYDNSKSVRRSTPHKIGGRRVYVNQFGEHETERSMTVKSGKKWINVPSFNTKTGENFKSEKKAKRVARKRGETSKKYKTIPKAEKAAAKRSNKLGRKLNRKLGRPGRMKK